MIRSFLVAALLISGCSDSSTADQQNSNRPAKHEATQLSGADAQAIILGAIQWAVERHAQPPAPLCVDQQLGEPLADAKHWTNRTLESWSTNANSLDRDAVNKAFAKAIAGKGFAATTRRIDRLPEMVVGVSDSNSLPPECKFDNESGATIVTLSAPVAVGEIAFVEAGAVCGGLCGSGDLLILERRGHNWNVVANEPTWIS